MKTKKSIPTAAALIALAGISLLASSCAGSSGLNISQTGPPGKGLVTTDPAIYVHHGR